MTEVKLIVTDPVNSEITREEGNFHDMWFALGQEIKAVMADGPDETTWCNIGVTHEADTIGHCVMHRTISLG